MSPPHHRSSAVRAFFDYAADEAQKGAAELDPSARLLMALEAADAAVASGLLPALSREDGTTIGVDLLKHFERGEIAAVVSTLRGLAI